jgi:tetratricopeptide (TPR) repeat protein
MAQKIQVFLAELKETVYQTITFLLSGNPIEILCRFKDWIWIRFKDWIWIRFKDWIWDIDWRRNTILFILAALIEIFVFGIKQINQDPPRISKILEIRQNGELLSELLLVLIFYLVIIGIFSIARLFEGMRWVRFFLISFLGLLLAKFWDSISVFFKSTIEFWDQSIRINLILSTDLNQSFTFTNIINFIAVTILGVFLFLFFRWISSSSGINILPFDDSDLASKNEKKDLLNGNVIADLLAVKLHRIHHLHNFIEDGKLQVMQTSSSLLSICRENLNLSLLKGEHLDNSLTQVGSLSINDKTILQLGSILFAIRRLWPLGLVQVITGSIGEFKSKDGLKLKLTARYEQTNHHADIHAYEINQELSNITLPDMVNDLAYRIALDASPKPLSTSNWEAFKFFTEALSCLYRHERTKSLEELNQAFKLCKDANNKDKNYRKVGDLLSLISFAYLNRDRYQKAEESLKKALAINPTSCLVQISFGDKYYLSGQYDQAFEHYKYAKKLNPSCSEIYSRTGRIHIVAPQPPLKDYDLARKDLWYALNLKPRDYAAQSILAWLDFLCHLKELEKGHYEKAEINLDKALNRLNKMPQKKKTHLDYSNTAIFYLYKGNEKEAYESWWKALQICPHETPGGTIYDELHSILYKLLTYETTEHSIEFDRLIQILKGREVPLYKKVLGDLIGDAAIIKERCREVLEKEPMARNHIKLYSYKTSMEEFIRILSEFLSAMESNIIDIQVRVEF